MNITFFGWHGAKPYFLAERVHLLHLARAGIRIGLLPTNNGTMPRRDSISSDSAVEDEL